MTAFPSLLPFALLFGCVCGAPVAAALRPAALGDDAPTRADADPGTANDGRGRRGIFWQLSGCGGLWKGLSRGEETDSVENAVSGKTRVRRLS